MPSGALTTLNKIDGGIVSQAQAEDEQAPEISDADLEQALLDSGMNLDGLSAKQIHARTQVGKFVSPKSAALIAADHEMHRQRLKKLIEMAMMFAKEGGEDRVAALKCAVDTIAVAGQWAQTGLKMAEIQGQGGKVKRQKNIAPQLNAQNMVVQFPNLPLDDAKNGG